MINTVIGDLSVTPMKSGNLFDDFVWRRARGGYVWKDVGGAPLLVAADGTDAVVETYRLGDKSSTGLFMQFADLTTPDAVLAFANQFGPLGYPVTVEYVEATNGRLVCTSGRRMLLNYPHARWGEFFAPARGRHPADRLPGNSWMHHAHLIRWLIRARQTRKRLDPLVKDAADLALREAVAVTLNDQLDGQLAPVSLIGALWLQAALAGGKEYRKCPVCSTPIEISRTGGARADAVFCSDRCKSKDYRQRRATARSLHDDGVALRKIAKQIDTDLETVKNWLK